MSKDAGLRLRRDPEIDAILAERDQLKAENERLRGEVDFERRSSAILVQTIDAERERLAAARAEVERLRRTVLRQGQMLERAGVRAPTPAEFDALPDALDELSGFGLRLTKRGGRTPRDRDHDEDDRERDALQSRVRELEEAAHTHEFPNGDGTVANISCAEFHRYVEDHSWYAKWQAAEAEVERLRGLGA